MPEVIKQWFIKHMPVEEDIGLHENKAFIRWIGYPLLAVLGLVIAVTWNLFEAGIYSFNSEFEVSFVTLNDFAKYYAFPIASLTVPLTFGVMFNRFHSSKQKAKSNRLVEHNNSANNFFNHYKYFSEYCEKILERQDDKRLKIKPEVCYKFLFKESSVENFTTEVDIYFINNFFNCLADEVNKYKDIIKRDGYQDHNEPFASDVKIIKGHFVFNLSLGGIELMYPVGTDKSLYEIIEESIDVLKTLLNFNGVSGTRKLIDSTQILKEKFIREHFETNDKISIKF